MMLHCLHKPRTDECSVCRPGSTYEKYRRDAERRHHQFDITVDDFKRLVAKECYLCGTTSEPRGLDRVRNSEGYTVPNVKPCCSTCNMMKGTLDIGRFVERTERIVNRMRDADVEAANWN
jgi:hypothetical protein